jgi:hypothetical protein
MLPSLVGRTALLALAGLLATLLSLVVTTAPALAAVGCQSEVPGPLGLPGCDDVTPPDTVGAGGEQSAAGQATIHATSSYGTTGDTDPVAFECQLKNTAIWGPCVVSNLTPDGYDFLIRAVDTADLAIIACAGLLCTGTEVPDYDATPETVHVTITGGTGGGGGGSTPPPPGPGGAPETQITGGPRDKITPSQPVSLTRRPTVQLTASEPATFNCAINARKVPCQGGVTVLKGLKPGTQVFVAQAVDKDGNFDATPASLTFYVPYDLSANQGMGWKKVKSHGSYAGDYVATTRKNAVLTLGDLDAVREVRLVAPVGPRLGKVAVRVGKGSWMKVSLKAAKAQRLRIFELRGDGAHPLSGAIQIKALKIPSGGSVAVDAIVAR